MGRQPDISRLERLESLALLLREQERITLGDLAERLAVSKRTLNRDLALLRRRGAAINASVGRGGGVRLDHQWQLGRNTLDYREATGLLLALALAEKLGGAVLPQTVASIRKKVVSSFSPAERGRISLMRRRILVCDPSSPQVLSTITPSRALGTAVLYRAFFEMKAVNIDYVDMNGARTTRLIEPNYLLLAVPAWYVLAWDHLRNAVRCFRLDRIHGASLTDTTFKLRPESQFEELVAGLGTTI